MQCHVHQSLTETAKLWRQLKYVLMPERKKQCDLQTIAYSCPGRTFPFGKHTPRVVGTFTPHAMVRMKRETVMLSKIKQSEKGKSYSSLCI